MNVEFYPDMDDYGRNVALREAVAELETFYESNHNLAKNIDTRKRGLGSDDGASAESALGEPVQKDVKTE